MLRSPLVRVLGTLCLMWLLVPWLPRVWLEALFTCSSLMRDLLLVALPPALTIFIATALAPLGLRASFLVLALIGFELISNSASVGCAFLASLCQPLSLHAPPVLQNGLESWMRLRPYLPGWWSPQVGVLLGLFCGFLMVLGPLKSFEKSFQKARQLYHLGLRRFFSPLLPLFVAGFFADLCIQASGGIFLQVFSSSLLSLLVWLSLYVMLLFGVATLFRPSDWWRVLRNCLPSGLMAATSMCSVATLPTTLAAAEKNLRNPKLAQFLIPSTVNVQMPGDCFVNIFLAFTMLPIFQLPLPPPMELASFAIAFVLARFAAVGSPTGGALFLMLPLYEQYLHFTPEMLSLMIGFNALLDPVVTSANVMGNGALALLFERLFGRRFAQHPAPIGE